MTNPCRRLADDSTTREPVRLLARREQLLVFAHDSSTSADDSPAAAKTCRSAKLRGALRKPRATSSANALGEGDDYAKRKEKKRALPQPARDGAVQCRSCRVE